MIRALVIAALVLTVSCKKEPADDGESKPEGETEGVSFDCKGRQVVADYQAPSGELRSHLEIGCDEGPPYIRGTITKSGSEQPMVAKITADDLDEVWQALDEAKWSELPEECGNGGDMVLTLKIRSDAGGASYECKGSATPAHAELVRALELVAPDQTFKGLKVAELRDDNPLDQLKPGMDADKAAMNELLDGYEIVETDSAIEEGMRKIKLFTISKDGTEVAFARAEKGKIFAVRLTEAGYRVADGKATLGEALDDTSLIEDCGCRGEDGVDGFHCQLEGSTDVLVFETADGDCSFTKPEEVREAVKGRKPTGLQRAAR